MFIHMCWSSVLLFVVDVLSSSFFYRFFLWMLWIIFFLVIRVGRVKKNVLKRESVCVRVCVMSVWLPFSVDVLWIER